MAIPKANRKTSPRPITAEVRQFMHFNREGDIIPHGWNKKIGVWHDATKRSKDENKDWVKAKQHVWRSRPFAERLLARIVWFYTPSPIKDNSGKVTGWRRKFKGPFWQLNTAEMADALGCSSRTIRAEIDLLKTLGLITTKPARERTAADGTKNIPIFVVPVYESIVGLTRAEEESSLAAEEESSLEPRKNLPNSSIPPHSSSSNTGLDDAKPTTGAAPEANTQPLQEEKEVEQKAIVPPAAPPAPARAPAPPTRKPDPEQVRHADDLLQRHIAHKDGGKLVNWNITRNALEAAIANRHHEDKKAINAACDELKDVVAAIANRYGWRSWFDRKSVLQIIALDLPLDQIESYVMVDAERISQKQKERDGYGPADALQAVRIAMAAQAGPPKKERNGEYYTDQYGELKWRWAE